MLTTCPRLQLRAGRLGDFKKIKIIQPRRQNFHDFITALSTIRILRSEQAVFRPICTESIFHIGPMHTFIYLQNWKIWHKLRNYEVWTFHKVSNSKTSNCVIRKQQRTAKTRLFTNGYILFYSLTGDLHSNHLSSDFLSNFFFVSNFPQPTKFPDFSRFPYISQVSMKSCVVLAHAR